MARRQPDGIAIKFGEEEIVGDGIEARVHHGMNEGSTAQVTIAKDRLTRVLPNYRAAVEVSATYGTEREAMFTGFIDRVLPEGPNVRLDLVTQTHLMNDASLGGLGLRNVDPREGMWALSVLGGYAPENVIVQGWEPGPLEIFEVAVPIDGVELHEPTTFGKVTLYSGGPVARLAEGLGPEELEDCYTGATTWALTLNTARTLYDAEIEALKDVDLALGWLTAKAHYSEVSLPGRAPQAFHRQRTLSRITRRDVVVVRGIATGRQWLRAPEDIPSRPQFVLSEVGEVELPPLPSNLPTQVREAITAWQRAAEAKDPLAAVVALWEAVEFYAAGASTNKIFGKAELKALRRRASEGLEGEQLERVQDVIARINEPPLMARLRSALDVDKVPYKESELSLLQKVRRARNDLVHGRSRDAPLDADLRYATAIVNRMLVYRVDRLNVGAVEHLSAGSLTGSPSSILEQLERNM